MAEKEGVGEQQQSAKNTAPQQDPGRASASDGGTVVGLSKTKKIGLAALTFLVVGGILYFTLFRESPEEQAKKLKSKPTKEAVEKALKDTGATGVRGVDEADDQPALPMQLPDLPELSIPEPPKPPPPPPSRGDDDSFNPFNFGKESKPGAAAAASKKLPPAPGTPGLPGVPGAPGGSKSSPLLPPPATIPPPPSAAKGADASPVLPDSYNANTLSPKIKMERRSASMIALGGKAGGKDRGAKKPISFNEPLGRTSAAQVKDSYYGERDRMIAQGKMIEIILETAINTDLKGMLRGIVSRDIYAESGTNILIPRGSRAIGTYSASLGDGQSRVAVVWNRIMRPDGVDVVLEMPGTDKLGRSGISGEVDYHLAEAIRNSLLMSMLTIVSGVITNEIFNTGVVTETVNPSDGAVTTSSSGGQTSTQGVMDDILSELRDRLDKTETTDQTIRVESGTIINAFVRQDIIFVGDSAFAYRERE